MQILRVCGGLLTLGVLYLVVGPALLVVVAILGGLFLLGWLDNLSSAQDLRLKKQVDTRLRCVEREPPRLWRRRPAFRVVTEWLSPETSVLHTFRTRRLAFDPSPYLDPERIPVLVRPDCPTKYHFELGLERLYLEAGLGKLRPLLEAHGFEWEPVAIGATHSRFNTWAVVHLRRPNLEIGLIVRNQNELGCPNYAMEPYERFASHRSLLAALHKQDGARLVPESQHGVSYRAKDGGDPIDALHADLRDAILPVLRESEEKFFKALSDALRSSA